MIAGYQKGRIAAESTAHFLPPAGRCADRSTAYRPASARKQCLGYAGTATGCQTDATSAGSAARRESSSRLWAMSSPPIKRTIGCRAVITACTGTLGFFFCASIIAGLVAAALWTGRLSRITRLTLRSCSPRLSCCSASPLAKNSEVTNLDAVGEILRQPVEKCHSAGRSRGPKVAGSCQPVLADARGQRRQAGKKFTA